MPAASQGHFKELPSECSWPYSEVRESPLFLGTTGSNGSRVRSRGISKRPFAALDFPSSLNVLFGRGPDSHPTGLHARAGSHRVTMTSTRSIRMPSVRASTKLRCSVDVADLAVEWMIGSDRSGSGCVSAACPLAKLKFLLSCSNSREPSCL